MTGGWMMWIRSLPARGRLLFSGQLTGILLITLLAVTLPYFEPLRLSVFDFYQSVYPRVRRSAPAVIVAIDEESLRLHGQWPWPRTWLAQLVARVAEARPAAIGIDIVMPEPDRLSPGRLPEFVPGMGRDLIQRLSGLPSNDAVLARTLQAAPVVLGAAGLESDAVKTRRAVPWVPPRIIGRDPRPFIRRFDSTLNSVEEIDSAAKGLGLLSVDTERGVVRRMPLVAAVANTLVPAFGVEMLRVATGGAVVAVRTGASGVEAVEIRDLVIPTEPDGSVRVHFTRPDSARFVSASRVLAGKVDPHVLERKLVLIGVTALGLSDYQATPVADRMAGVEIHAQLLENIFNRALLTRPRSLAWIEMGLALLVGVAMLWVVDRAAVWASLMIAASLVAALVGVPMGLFRSYGILLDPTPAIVAVFALLAQQSLVKLNRPQALLLPSARQANTRGWGGRPAEQSSARSHGGLSRLTGLYDLRRDNRS
jgi:CHASE2 domain-containing sensor protein